MDIVEPSIDRYLNDALAEHDPILREMGEYGRSRGFPIIGPQVGRFIHILARSINAKHVLELGSGFGYSAFWFALALGPGGRVAMTEGAKENSELARSYFERAGFEDRAEFHVGDALEIAHNIRGRFDIVFCDIDKDQYPKAMTVAREKIRAGGYFICDNMLRRGSVLHPHGDAQARGVVELTRQLLEASDFDATILPVREGVSIALRLA